MGWEDFSRSDLEALCSPVILERGESYYHEGHLSKTCCFENAIFGQLIGTGSLYQATIRLETESVGWDCTCPYPDFCKHLAALATAWLENPERFVKADSILAAAVAGSDPLELLRRLVARDPFVMVELNDVAPNSGKGDFISNRGILNLVRNLFPRVSFRPDEAAALWEKVQNVGALLAERLNQADAGALEPWIELWNALLAAYQRFRDPKLKEALDQQLQQIPVMLEKYDLRQISDLFEIISQNYFDPLLWELGSDIRWALGQFVAKYPELAKILTGLPQDRDNYLQLAACYELILALPPVALKQQYLVSLRARLIDSPEGRLWLIDRLAGDEPDEAYRMAKAGLRAAASMEKAPFRERLIHIHRIRLEFRQAAALSYLQFCEKPSVEEYERLKEILIALPHDFQNYHHKMVDLLEQKGLFELLIKVLISAGEEDRLAELVFKIVNQKEILLSLMNDLTTAIRPTLLESRVYPAVIFTALDHFNTPTPRNVLRLVAAYKKCCLQSGREDLWQEFSDELKHSLGDYPDYQRKFGALL